MIICIAGPSGIGKTKLSIMLAKKYQGIIINADATQIYQELNIGSAKITETEKEGIKHYLLDIKNPNDDYSVSEFQKDARQIIDANQDKNIIVVGGTGLYLKALFNDYHFNEIKKQEYPEKTNEELYQMALQKDPNMNIHINNRVRLVNFLNNEKPTYDANKELYNVTYIGLTTDRETLYNLINKRVDIMIDNGLFKEVETLYQKYPKSGILKRAIGYKEIIGYLDGLYSKEEAIDLIKKNTRHFVKRQYTWFNNQMHINWFNVDLNNFNNTYEEIIEFIESLNSK